MSDKVVQKKERDLEGVLLLQADNFTPIERTPWGGGRIAELKKGLAPASSEQAVIGESWEISVSPEFPSRLVDGTELTEAIAGEPDAWLGLEADRGSTSLLVKLLDTAQHLSVQIHPANDYAGLQRGEGGKIECWYVIRRDEDAGLFVGLEPGVTRQQMRDAIENEQDVSKLLYFLPVEPGDCFLIEPGTPHCIGRGVTLVEPQRVPPNRRGVTYRYWDWNRRYNRDGKLDPKGTPRALHVEHALAVTNWSRARGEALLATTRFRAGGVDLAAVPQLEPLVGADGPLRSSALSLHRLSGSGRFSLSQTPRLRGLTVIDGSVRTRRDEPPTVIGRGQSAVIPACTPEIDLVLERAHALLSWVT